MQVRKVDEFTKQKVADLKKAVKSLQDQARNIKKNDNTQELIEVTPQADRAADHATVVTLLASRHLSCRQPVS